MGHEEEIGTNNFCLVELDLLMRISNMELMIDFIHSFIFQLKYLMTYSMTTWIQISIIFEITLPKQL